MHHAQARPDMAGRAAPRRRPRERVVAGPQQRLPRLPRRSRRRAARGVLRREPPHGARRMRGVVHAAEPGAPRRLLHDHTPERVPDVAEGRRAEPGQPDAARAPQRRDRAERRRRAAARRGRSGEAGTVRAQPRQRIPGPRGGIRRRSAACPTCSSSADVIPFMSNPDTEAASYAVYRDTILKTARHRGLDVRSLERRLSGESGAIVFGERIHHREAR